MVMEIKENQEKKSRNNHENSYSEYDFLFLALLHSEMSHQLEMLSEILTQ